MTQPVEDERLLPSEELLAYLAWRHSRDQEENAQALALALWPLWEIMRFDSLDASTAAWLPGVLDRVETAYYQAQRMTAVYNVNVRFASLPLEEPLSVDLPDVQRPAGGVFAGGWNVPQATAEGPIRTVPAGDPFPSGRVANSLAIEANVLTKRAMPGPEAELMADARVRSSGAAIREAVNGSRNATHNWIRNDRKKLIGYARVTDSDPCAFCAILASRGAVFTKDSFLKKDAKFTPNEDAPTDLPDGFSNVAKVHNHCKCVLRPVYSKADSWDAAAKHYRKLWDRVDKDVGQWLPTREKRAGEVKQFKELLDASPFPGNSFDLYGIRKKLDDRESGLLDAGLSPADPRVRWGQGMRIAV
jgi:hypothetical protein